MFCGKRQENETKNIHIKMKYCVERVVLVSSVTQIKLEGIVTSKAL